MKSKVWIWLLIAASLAMVAVILFFPPPIPENLEFSDDSEVLAKGEYLVTAGGCISCHRGVENEEAFSGGLGLETDFGTFYVPNITPDAETGIGGWSAGEFARAMRHGWSSSDGFYFPSFPYRSYAGLTDEDVVAMGSWLMSMEPVRFEAPAHETPWWLIRPAMAGWNLLAGLYQPPEEVFENELVERGAYLARNLGHCGECHTPRNSLGVPIGSREFAGAELGEDTVEAIDAASLEEWTFDNFDLFLLIGLKPDGEFVGGDMNEVIEFNTSRLSDEDRDALAAFFTRHRQED